MGFVHQICFRGGSKRLGIVDSVTFGVFVFCCHRLRHIARECHAVKTRQHRERCRFILSAGNLCLLVRMLQDNRGHPKIIFQSEMGR